MNSKINSNSVLSIITFLGRRYRVQSRLINEDAREWVVFARGQGQGKAALTAYGNPYPVTALTIRHPQKYKSSSMT